jgi:uncharacterized protein (UPF0333 family)
MYLYITMSENNNKSLKKKKVILMIIFVVLLLIGIGYYYYEKSTDDVVVKTTEAPVMKPRMYASVANQVTTNVATVSFSGGNVSDGEYSSSATNLYPSYRSETVLYGKKNEEGKFVHFPTTNSFPLIATKEGCKARCEGNVNCNAFQHYPNGVKLTDVAPGNGVPFNQLGAQCILLSVIANPNGDPVDLLTSTNGPMNTYWRK